MNHISRSTQPPYVFRHRQLALWKPPLQGSFLTDPKSGDLVLVVDTVSRPLPEREKSYPFRLVI